MWTHMMISWSGFGKYEGLEILQSFWPWCISQMFHSQAHIQVAYAVWTMVFLTFYMTTCHVQYGAKDTERCCLCIKFSRVDVDRSGCFSILFYYFFTVRLPLVVFMSVYFGLPNRNNGNQSARNWGRRWGFHTGSGVVRMQGWFVSPLWGKACSCGLMWLDLYGQSH